MRTIRYITGFSVLLMAAILGYLRVISGWMVVVVIAMAVVCLGALEVVDHLKITGSGIFIDPNNEDDDV